MAKNLPVSISMPADLKAILDEHIAQEKKTVPMGAHINRNSWIVELIRRELQPGEDPIPSGSGNY